MVEGSTTSSSVQEDDITLAARPTDGYFCARRISPKEEAGGADIDRFGGRFPSVTWEFKSIHCVLSP